jgi:hypothetical protein
MKLPPDGYTIVGTRTEKAPDDMPQEAIRKANSESFDKAQNDVRELEAMGYSVMVYFTQTNLLYRKK